MQEPLPKHIIAHVIFRIDESLMVLLHRFIKKTRKTPQKDIDPALKRKFFLRPHANRSSGNHSDRCQRRLTRRMFCTIREKSDEQEEHRQLV